MKRFLIAGLAIILITNAFILVHVAINRSGEPASTLVLSERELNLGQRGMFDGENSADTVKLSFIVVSPENHLYNRNFIIEREEAIELGFNVEQLSESERSETLNLYWVLELDGEKYREQLRYARDEVTALTNEDAAETEINYARKRVEQVENEFSRLYLLDVGTNADALYEEYKGKDNVVVVEGESRLIMSSYGEEYRLFFQKILVSQIMVPPEYRPTINQYYAVLDNDQEPGFKATISWGQLNEPWFVSLSLNSDE